MRNLRRLPDKANQKHRFVRYEMDVQDHPRKYFIEFGKEEYQEIIMHFDDRDRPEFDLRASKNRLAAAIGMHQAWESLYAVSPTGDVANPIIRIFFNYQNVL